MNNRIAAPPPLQNDLEVFLHIVHDWYHRTAETSNLETTMLWSTFLEYLDGWVGGKSLADRHSVMTGLFVGALYRYPVYANLPKDCIPLDAQLAFTDAIRHLGY